MANSIAISNHAPELRAETGSLPRVAAAPRSGFDVMPFLFPILFAFVVMVTYVVGAR